ncbi:unnamed protein product [Brachionus calyciflorus]|uniref:Uncharacterized protein n=1 Tax=Brachionus calyciflorus TaxID=104777 RepID=A0A814E6M4_9BILA|nr:unnamed protein product [Brachionus calyciflorus]
MADTIRFQRIIEEHYTNLVNKLDIYTETKLSQNNGLSEEIKTNLNNSRQKILDKINTVKSANLANLQETNFKSRIESLKNEKAINSIIFSNGYLFEDEFVLENNTIVPCFINWYHFLDGDRLKRHYLFDDFKMFYEVIL